MTPNIKRIVVPLDFSANSRRALEQAIEIALRFDAAIHLIHACYRPAMTVAPMDADAMALADRSLQIGVNAAAELAEIAGRVRGVRVSTEVRFGRPAPIIVETATSRHADLIVMGAHGHGTLMSVVLGGVAEQVVRSAPCAVLTVREPRVRGSERTLARKLCFAAKAILAEQTTPSAEAFCT